MANVEVTVPDLGVETAVEIIEVCVEPGQSISVDDPLIVLESDKATMEVPAPQSGVVKEIVVKVGQEVGQGDLILHMSGDSGEANAPEELGEEVANIEVQTPPETTDVPLENATSTQTKVAALPLDILVPDLGGAEEVEVIEVLVSPGDQVESDQAMLVLESDKATMEIPTPAGGEILDLSVKVGDRVSEGDKLGTLQSSEASTQASAAPLNERSASTNISASAPSKANPASPEASTVSQPLASDSDKSGRAHAGPAVRKMARELGVELANVPGSGRKGRVLKDDLKTFVKNAMQNRSGVSNTGAMVEDAPLPDFTAFGEIDVREMSKLQTITAVNMQRSWNTVPHVTQFDFADITELESFRKNKKAEAEKRGVKLTLLPFLVKACANALEDLPQFNVSLDMRARQLIHKHYINIGIAVDSPAGLVVPVIKDVDKKSIWQLAEDCQKMALAARERKLSPADMQGACFTISSLGGIGGTSFTPIVNTPEVAILGVSKAEWQPKYDGSEFEPRLMLPLSLSYDHRAVNGVDGARFTAYLGKVLADIREMLL